MPADPVEFLHTYCVPSDVVEWLGIVGVDPGLLDFIKAVRADFGLHCGGKGASSYTDNSVEHRRACGVQRHKRSQERRVRGGVQAALDRIPRAGLISVHAAVQRTQQRLAAWPSAFAVYGSRWQREARFSKHCLRLAHFDRIVQRMCWGFAGGGGGKWMRGVVRPRRRKPFGCIVGFGNASAGHNSIIKRTQGAPVKALCSFIRRNYSKRHNVVLCMIDEFRTSQVCSKCLHWKVRKLSMALDASGMDGGIPGVLERGRNKLVACQSDACMRTHNTPFVADRDLNAALNMLHILLALLFGVRPRRRRHKQLATVFRQVRGAVVGDHG